MWVLIFLSFVDMVRVMSGVLRKTRCEMAHVQVRSNSVLMSNALGLLGTNIL